MAEALPTPREPSTKRKPTFSKHIHIPGYQDSFTYELCSGKRKIDQSLQRFCLKHHSIGVFEAKLHLKKFGISVQQVNKIKYDATKDGMAVSLASPNNGFSLFIPYPSKITVRVPRNPEALYLGSKIGILSCRVPISEHNLELYHYNAHKQPKLGALGAKKKRKWNNKLDHRLHHNHEKLSNMQTQQAVEADDSEHLTGFQRSLYGKEKPNKRMLFR